MALVRNVLSEAIFVLLMSSSAIAGAPQAQIASGDLKGSIFDPSKAVVAGGRVTSTNVSTGVVRSTSAMQQVNTESHCCRLENTI